MDVPCAILAASCGSADPGAEGEPTNDVADGAQADLEPEPELASGLENATRAARNYLNLMTSPRSGLINQLVRMLLARAG